MTQDEIIEIANKAGSFDAHKLFYFTPLQLKLFAKLVAQHEREACAKVCDDMVLYTGYDCAEAIRAMGQA